VHLCENWLGIKGIDMRGPTLHHQENHPLGFRCEVPIVFLKWKRARLLSTQQ
jgi:hypothetical protein